MNAIQTIKLNLSNINTSPSVKRKLKNYEDYTYKIIRKDNQKFQSATNKKSPIYSTDHSTPKSPTIIKCKCGSTTHTSPKSCLCVRNKEYIPVSNNFSVKNTKCSSSIIYNDISITAIKLIQNVANNISPERTTPPINQSKEQTQTNIDYQELDRNLNNLKKCNRCHSITHLNMKSKLCQYNKSYTPTSTSTQLTKICKCGSNQHKYITHNTCLLNKKNNTNNLLQQFNEIPIDSNNNCASCGSYGHKRRSSMMCRFNKNYLQQTTQINTLDDFNDIIENEISFSSEPVQTIKQLKTYRIARNTEFLESSVTGENVIKNIDSPHYARHFIPKRDQFCRYCNSLMWLEEKLVNSSQSKPIFSTCCLSGKVSLEKEIKLPDSLFNLLISKNEESEKFRISIRLYNSILSFASVSANIDDKLLPAYKGVYTYRINGRVHHKLSSLQPREESQPKFSQIYIYDSEMQSTIRSGMFPDTINSHILNKIQSLLDEFNPYVRIYKQAGELLRQQPSIALNIILKSNKTKDKTLNAPTSNEIAVLMINNDDENHATKRDIIVKQKTEGPYDTVFLNENVSYYDPLAYPLFLLNGEQGWQYATYPKLTEKQVKQIDIQINNKRNALLNQHLLNQPATGDDIIIIDNEDEQLNDQLNQDTETNNKFISAREYYSFKLQDREDSCIPLFGRLYHQYIVDNYAKIEMGRLTFLRMNQKKLRADLYKGAHDAVNSIDFRGAAFVGKTIILPSSFTGCPRQMKALYQDSMSVIRKFGKPDLFCTITCNPAWPEILSELKEHQTANDRPDLIARVFNMKLKALMHDIIKNQIFGKTVAHIYVVEWQKRGLPHAHILIVLSGKDKVNTVEDIDSLVSAEIPDINKHPKAYETVSKCMVHGPCGAAFPKSPCMKDGKCSKKFPKDFAPITILGQDSYPIYKRRNNNEFISKSGIQLDNQWIVPHNLYLSTKFNCHINLEICNSIGAVKYLFKYVYKGSDQVEFSMQTADSLNNIEPQINGPKDEITQFQNARFVSASEACHRIYQYLTHAQYPPTERLPVHCKDEHTISYDESSNLQEVLEKNEKTKLTEYFKISSEDTIAEQLYYYEMPNYFTWNLKDKKWCRRIRGELYNGSNESFIENKLKVKENVGRMYFVHPNEHERFALRTLLLYRKGCKSFEQIRTVEGQLCDTNKQAVILLGLAEDDSEWLKTFEEAVHISTPVQLRELFVMIIIHCSPTSPGEIWQINKKHLAEDILYEKKIKFRNNNYQYDDDIYNIALQRIDNILKKNGKSLENYSDMPKALYSNDEESVNQPSIIMEETSYDKNQLNEIIKTELPKMNSDQKLIYEKIIKRTESNQIGQNAFFIDGPGGTGKTFLYKILLAAIRIKGHIALAVASSGIAAQLLEGGRTAHSRLKVPFELTSTSTCNINLQSIECQLIKQAQIILWDECPMTNRYAFEALDRSLKDIMSTVDPIYKNIPFGNKIMVFGGDFRQILPVIKKGNQQQIVAASFNRSILWQNINVMKLTINMRIQRMNAIDAVQAQKFADLLIRIGEGKENNVQDDSGLDDLIKLHDQILTNCSMKELIIKTFPNIIKNFNESDYTDRVILATTNAQADTINQIASDMLPGNTVTKLSIDSILDDANQHLYPTEFLNILNISGLPPHELHLKKDLPIICLRNINPNDGLCNGTRLKIIDVTNRLIQAKITIGQFKGKIVFIPRMPLIPSDTNLPFDFKRIQFPVRPAFAITINKSQGQTLGFVAIWLGENFVFSHGQLYVALSRVSSMDNILISTSHPQKLTRNVVFKEIFR